MITNNDLDARWAAWIARGRLQDQQVRHRFIVLGGALALAIVVLSVFFR